MKRLFAAVVGLCLIATGASSFWQSRLQVSEVAVAAPVNTVAPVITTPSVQAAFGVQGQTLTASNGTWTGSPTFTYQWQRAGTNISGATASSYVVQSADDASPAGTLNLNVIVTGTNGGGSVPATSSNSISGIEGTVFLNESFPTQDSWSSSAGFSWTGNKMVLTAVGAFNSSNRLIAGMTAGDTYRIIYDVTFTGGNQIIDITGTTNVGGTLRSTNGTFTDNIVAPAAPTGIFDQAQATTTGTMTNILMVQR